MRTYIITVILMSWQSSISPISNLSSYQSSQLEFGLMTSEVVKQLRKKRAFSCCEADRQFDMNNNNCLLLGECTLYR